MEITAEDRLFYLHAVDRLTERFEIAREFVRNNGMSSFPMEELTDLMIVGIKDWVKSNPGEQWLSTLGYVKSDYVTITGVLHVCLSGSQCPVCSGMFMEHYGNYCERCGSYTCGPCSSIVDPIYHVNWCNHCLEEQPLTSLLVYSE